MDTAVGLLAGMVTFPVVMSFGLQDVISGSTLGTIFIALPTGLGSLGATGQLVAVLFFALALIAAITSAAVLYALPRPLNGGKPLMTLIESSALVIKSCSGLVGVVLLVLFAFALGQVSRELEMGPYIVGLIGDGVPAWWLPALVFVVGAFVAP